MFDSILGNIFDTAGLKGPVLKNPRAQHMVAMAKDLNQRSKCALGSRKDDLMQVARCITEMALAIEIHGTGAPEA